MSKKTLSKKAIIQLNQEKELMIIQSSMFYLILFLEKAGIIKDGKIIKEIDNDRNDLKGALNISRQIMFTLSKVNTKLQNKTLEKANELMDRVEFNVDFNYLTFSLTLLMEYRENIKNKIYYISVSNKIIVDVFDEYFKLGIKNKEQMEVVKDSIKMANLFFQEVLNYGNQKNRKST